MYFTDKEYMLLLSALDREKRYAKKLRMNIVTTWIPFVILIAFFIIGYIANTISQNRVKK